MTDAQETKPPAKTNVNVGRDVSGVLVAGDNNVVTINQSEPNRLRSLHQLPPAPADFTGRAAHIRGILADFEKGRGAAISGLTGLGGVGKTALGLVVAERLKDGYSDAQLYLDLKGTTAPLTVLDIVRHVLLSFEPTADLRALDENNMLAAYQSVLHDKKALLFFDNARSAAQITPLRPPATCAMLVTSRWNFSMPGLTPHKLGVLTEQEAGDFLLALCPRVGAHAAELVNACGCLPLALRIAGSFLQVNPHWKVEAYLAQLTDTRLRLAALQSSRDQAELSEPDLQAAFALSCRQLQEEEQKRWRALGIFTSPFAADAAAALWGVGEMGAANTLGLLMRYSLLDYNETTARYDLHDLLADYGRGQMGAGEEREARIRHASHFMQVMQAANEMYLSGNDKLLPGLRLFDGEWEHIRAAQAWLADNKEDETAAELLMKYPNGIYAFLDLRLAPRQMIGWLEPAVFVAKKLGNKQYEGVHLGNLGLAHSALGEAHEAIGFYEQALELTREIGDLQNEGKWLGNLGSVHAALGEVRKAIEYYQQALGIMREIGDRRNEGNWLGNLGLVYADLGEVRQAIEFHEQALGMAREIGDRRGEGIRLGNLGNAYAVLGETHKAIEFYEQALGITREIGDRSSEGNWLGSLGNAWSDSGEACKAIEFYEQALGITREIGDRQNEGSWLGNLGLVYAALGEVRQAIECYEQALEITREIGDRRGEEIRLGNLGNAHAALGDARKAIEFHEQALVIAREIGDRRGEGAALTNLGNALHGLGEKERGIQLVKQALEIFEAIESPYREPARNALRAWGALE
jgi:tetratricopeptide (TPR) repeat protein